LHWAFLDQKKLRQREISVYANVMFIHWFSYWKEYAFTKDFFNFCQLFPSHKSTCLFQRVFSNKKSIVTFSPSFKYSPLSYSRAQIFILLSNPAIFYLFRNCKSSKEREKVSQKVLENWKFFFDLKGNITVILWLNLAQSWLN